MEVDILVDIDKIVAGIDEDVRKVDKSSNKALGSVGFEATRIFRKEVAKSTAIPTLSLLAGEYSTRGKVKSRLLRKKRAYRRLKGLSRYSVSNNRVGIGVGKEKKTFSYSLTKLLKRAEKGRKQKVTPKMRRLFGLTRYPLKKTTEYLVTPKRLYMRNTYKKLNLVYNKIYNKRLEKEMS